MNAIEELLARERIRQLAVRYALAVDGKDLDEIAALRGFHWYFRRRRLKSWYHQEFGHPEHGTERTAEASTAAGPLRGSQMPAAFDTFDAFWSRPPREFPKS